MFIDFKGEIKVLKGVPLSNDYVNTLYFGDVASQSAYFETKVAKTFTKQSYTKHTNNVVSVNASADDIFDCNYITFQNVSFGSKKFYAFITDVEYVNNNTCNIFFEIDAIQTYLFDMTRLSSFVEREHSETDGIGDNITAEPVDTGEMVFDEHNKLPGFEKTATVVALASQDFIIDGATVDGVYTGLTLIAYNTESEAGVNSLNLLLTSAGAKPEMVISVYTVPTLLLGGVPSDEGTNLTIANSNVGLKLPYELPSIGFYFGQYVPRNKKLYTYPYNYIVVDNGGSSTMNLRYEFFEEDGGLEVTGSILQPVSSICRAKNYKGSERCNVENVAIGSYPTCSWVSDYYTQWLANNAVPLTNTVASSIMSLAKKDYWGAFGGVASVVGQSAQASIQSDVVRGSANVGSVNACYEELTFYRARCHVTEQYAQIIDNFFSKYGYATNRVKVPNINVRPNWTYTKTIDCNIVGEIPTVYLNVIKKAFNSGITFWKNPGNVGRYDLVNEVS